MVSSGFVSRSRRLKKNKKIMFLPHPHVKLIIVGSLCDREVACSPSDLQGLNYESCVWRAVSSHSCHHPQDVLLGQFSLYGHKSGLKPESFYFYFSLAYSSILNQFSVVSCINRTRVCSTMYQNNLMAAVLFSVKKSVVSVVINPRCPPSLGSPTAQRCCLDDRRIWS